MFPPKPPFFLTSLPPPGSLATAFPCIGECLKAVVDHAESGLDLVNTPLITQRVSQAVLILLPVTNRIGCYEMSEVSIKMLVGKTTRPRLDLVLLRSRANSAHLRPSRPDFGLGLSHFPGKRIEIL